MKLPRNIDASEFIKALQKYGYQPSRQTGSHIRLTTQQNGLHKITVPNHAPIRIGTLNAILADIAFHHGVTKQEVIENLF
ncbi:MAG: type II toxin-antitoxin system HicA family toxin [Bacteroidales bacterium]